MKVELKFKYYGKMVNTKIRKFALGFESRRDLANKHFRCFVSFIIQGWDELECVSRSRRVVHCQCRLIDKKRFSFIKNILKLYHTGKIKKNC